MEKRIVCGIHAVRGLLESSAKEVSAIYFSDKRNDQKLVVIQQLAETNGVKCYRVGKSRLNEITGGVRHQGVIAECSQDTAEAPQESFSSWFSSLKQRSFIVALDSIQDPRNLGACIRSASAAGADGLIIPRHRGANITATVSRVATGAAETIPIFRASNFARTLDELKSAGLWLVGLDAESPLSVYDMDFTDPSIVVFGSEETGLRRETEKKCDVVASIPTAHQVNTLNVSVAVGVVSFELVRQRKVYAELKS